MNDFEPQQCHTLLVLCYAYDAHVYRSWFCVDIDIVEMQPVTTNVTANPLCNACLWLGAVDCIAADTLACRWLPNLQQHVQCVLAHGHHVMILILSVWHYIAYTVLKCR